MKFLDRLDVEGGVAFFTELWSQKVLSKSQVFWLVMRIISNAKDLSLDNPHASAYFQVWQAGVLENVGQEDLVFLFARAHCLSCYLRLGEEHGVVDEDVLHGVFAGTSPMELDGRSFVGRTLERQTCCITVVSGPARPRDLRRKVFIHICISKRVVE